jgi:hypothetical protein
MNLTPTVLTIVTAVITSGFITALLNWYLKSKELGDQRRWEIKRKACLEALDIVDTRFADYEWKANGVPVKVDDQGFVSTARIRSCFNRLAVACNDSRVPQLFEKCLDLRVGDVEGEPLTMTTVIELRNAIRKELGFGHDLQTEVSWIMSINWRNSNKKVVSSTGRPSSRVIAPRDSHRRRAPSSR